MNNNLVQDTRNTSRRYYEDGLVELGVGILFALIGLALWFYQQALTGGSSPWLLSLGLVAVTLGGAFGANAILMRLKQRVTYPRTGQPALPRQDGGAGRWLLIGGVLVLVLMGFWLPAWATQMPAMVGALLTIIFLYLGLSMHLRRMLVAALLPVAAGVLAAYNGMAEVLGVATVFVATGSLLTLIGAIALERFLRQHPPQGGASA